MPVMSAVNFIHFYRKRILVNTLAATGFLTICRRARHWENETLRMGVAGCMAHGTVEAAFHFVDTVNIKSKASEVHTCTGTMVRKIWA